MWPDVATELFCSCGGWSGNVHRNIAVSPWECWKRALQGMLAYFGIYGAFLSDTGIHTRVHGWKDSFVDTRDNSNIPAEKMHTEAHTVLAKSVHLELRGSVLSCHHLYVNTYPTVWHFPLVWRKWGIFLDKLHNGMIKNYLSDGTELREGCVTVFGWCFLFVCKCSLSVTEWEK